MAKWGSVVERERHRRIMLCVYAYAYEVHANPLISDAAFDALALQSMPEVKTGSHDDWWKDNFNPSTGQWIHTHPDLEGIERLYNRLISPPT